MYVNSAVSIFLQLGGRRIDSADSYHNQGPVGAALLGSGLNRSEYFYVSKLGSSLPMGYADLLAQFQGVLNATVRPPPPRCAGPPRGGHLLRHRLSPRAP
jgi:diketogulonate reductase-like aldo/keto reductase